MILTGIKKKLGDFSLCIGKLNISRPGIYGLIGANGCGKSTLAKIMTGLMEPDSGTVDTEGLSIKDITFLSRKPYMMDDNIYNNIIYPLQIRKLNPDNALIEEYLDKMKLLKQSRQSARSLSGGEQQKLAFLRAIIFKPKFVITDEAMTAMDMDGLALYEKTIIEEQKKENSIWIIISHQMPHIKRICDYVFFMHDGKAETQGRKQEIFTNNDNFHLGSYLGTYDYKLLQDNHD